MARRIFISHSSRDRDFVDRLAIDLDRLGVDIWYDRWELKTGDSILDKIQSAIDKSDYIGVVLSTASVESGWVKKELNQALMNQLSGNDVTLLPILLEECIVPGFLRELRHADFRLQYEQGFQDLLGVIAPERARSPLYDPKYRSMLHLIAGLAHSEGVPFDLLSKRQLYFAYQYRQAFQTSLTINEKKVVFYSISCFHEYNREIHPLVDLDVPCWGLLSAIPETQYASWILDGVASVRPLSFIKRIEWAGSILEDSARATDQVINCLLMLVDVLGGNRRQGWEPRATYEQMLQCGTYGLRYLAQREPSIILEHFLPKLETGGDLKPALVASLGHLGGHSHVPKLVDLSRSADALTSAAAIESLIRLGVEEAVAGIRTFAERDSSKKDARTPQQSCNLLEKLDQPSFVLALKKWYREADHPLKATLLAARFNCGDEVRDELAQLLKMVLNTNSVSDRQIQDLRLKGKSTLLRLCGCLKDLPRELLEFLDSKDSFDRAYAAESIGRSGRREHTERLRTLLADKEEEVVISTIKALSMLDDRDSLPAMRRKIQTDSSIPIKCAVLSNLSRMHDMDMWDLLPVLLDREHETIAPFVGRAMCRVGSQSQIEAMLGKTVGTSTIVSAVLDQCLYAPKSYRPLWQEYDARLKETRCAITPYEDMSLVLYKFVHGNCGLWNCG